DAVLDAKPLTRRGRFWARLFRHASPIGLGGHLAFVGSAVIDSWKYTRDPRGHLTPSARREVTMRLRDCGARLSVRANTDDILHVLPGREKDVHDAILGGLVPGVIFVDVGANIGYYSVLAALRVSPHGSVMAVEP